MDSYDHCGSDRVRIVALASTPWWAIAVLEEPPEHSRLAGEQQCRSNCKNPVCVGRCRSHAIAGSERVVGDADGL